MIGKLFRLISLTKQRKYTKFPVFCEDVQKVFWNTTLFCRQWFRLLSALIFKSFFSKATSSWQYKCFFVDKFTKIGRNHESYLGKKVTNCDRSVKHFPFLQKQTLLETKIFMCHEYIKNVWKTFLKHQSLSVRQKPSSLRTTFTPVSITTSAYYIKLYSSKTMFHL